MKKYFFISTPMIVDYIFGANFRIIPTLVLPEGVYEICGKVNSIIYGEQIKLRSQWNNEYFISPEKLKEGESWYLIAFGGGRWSVRCKDAFTLITSASSFPSTRNILKLAKNRLKQTKGGN